MQQKLRDFAAAGRPHKQDAPQPEFSVQQQDYHLGVAPLRALLAPDGPRQALAAFSRLAQRSDGATKKRKAVEAKVLKEEVQGRGRGGI